MIDRRMFKRVPNPKEADDALMQVFRDYFTCLVCAA